MSTPDLSATLKGRRYLESLVVLMLIVPLFVLGSAILTFITLQKIDSTTNSTNKTAKQVEITAKDVKALTERIDSCTNTEGSCFKDANRRTGGAIQGINTNTIATVACSQNNTGFKAINSCVTATLKALSKPPGG